MYRKHKELTIRNAEKSDCAQLAAWWNDGKIMAHAGFPNGLQTTEEKIAAQIASDADDARRRLIIERDGEKIGEMSYTMVAQDVAEIGIKICVETEREKGLGKRLLSMLISYLFEERHCAKIILDTNLNNARAQHVYERLGFTRVRVRENAWRDQLGQWQSAVDYELTPDTFVDFAEE